MSLKIRQELVNNSVNGIHEIMKRWEQRFTSANPDFVQRFLSGQQAINIHYWPSVDYTKLWLAEFVHKDGESAHFSDPIGMAHDHLSHGKKDAVFAGIVKLAQQPKRIVPSLVRLEEVDEFYRTRLDELYVSSFGRFVTGRTFTDRELTSPQLFLCQSRKASKSQLRDQMVQRSPKIVNHVASCRQGMKRHVIHEDLTRPYFLGLNINLSARSLIVESQKASLHVEEVLFGPLNLRVNNNEARCSG